MSTLLPMYPETEQTAASESPVPRPLRDLWLRFHEKELCQDLDTVFVFHPKCMEVWCRVEDEKSYQRFSEMIEPLRSSFEIEVYVTRPASEKRSKEDDDPPPSLWNNTELQNYLQDSSRTIANSDPGRAPSERGSYYLKQRLAMWAVQVLSWNKKVRRYAADLPDLARLGFSTGVVREVKSHAAAVCFAHAQSLDKNIARLADSLALAMPKPEKGARRKPETDKPSLPSSPIELSALASGSSLAAAMRIHNFIYPQDYTVDLTNLREPPLLESLRELRRMLAELQRAAGAGR